MTLQRQDRTNTVAPKETSGTCETSAPGPIMHRVEQGLIQQGLPSLVARLEAFNFKGIDVEGKRDLCCA